MRIREVTFIAHALILVVFLLMFTPNKGSGHRWEQADRRLTIWGNCASLLWRFLRRVNVCSVFPAPGQTGINSPKYGPREDVMGKSKDISSRSTSPSAAKMSSWSLAGRCELGAPSRLNQINYPRKIRPTLAPSFHGESVEGMGRCRENVAPVGTIPIPG